MIPEVNHKHTLGAGSGGGRLTHLRRALAVLIAVLLFIFVVPRIMPTEEALQPFGFYRVGNNSGEWANQTPQYVDTARCNTCHQDKYATWQQAKHSTVSCETCHGPGRAHIEAQARPIVDNSREACGVCHGQLPSRPKDFPQVDLATHNVPTTCTTCHNPHAPQVTALRQMTPSPDNTQSGAGSAPKTETQLPRIPHSLEGRVDCLLCHNTGGLKPFPEDHAGRTSAVCLSCHGSK